MYACSPGSKINTSPHLFFYLASKAIVCIRVPETGTLVAKRLLQTCYRHYPFSTTIVLSLFCLQGHISAHSVPVALRRGREECPWRVVGSGSLSLPTGRGHTAPLCVSVCHFIKCLSKKKRERGSFIENIASALMIKAYTLNIKHVWSRRDFPKGSATGVNIVHTLQTCDTDLLAACC